MSTITTINSGDQITNTRAVINNNFSALNTDKIETSYLDTDTTLAANSDSKIATQKAVKTYIDGHITYTFKVGSTTYDLSTASGTQQIAHGLSTTPKIVRITAVYSDGGTGTSTEKTAYAYTSYDGTTRSSISTFQRSTNGSATGFDSEHTATFKITVTKGSADQTGVVTFGSTYITITWTKTGSPTGTANITWEAIG